MSDNHKNPVRGLTLATLLLLGAGTTASAQGVPIGRSAAPAALEGTWNVAVTPYVCATGVPVPGSTFQSRLSFHGGGAMTETNFNPSFQTGQRSPGLGSWERTGPNSYRAVFEAYIFFTSVVTPPTPPRYTRGQQRVEQGIEMQDENHWTSTAFASFFDASGSPLSSGCFNATAVRQQ